MCADVTRGQLWVSSSTNYLVYKTESCSMLVTGQIQSSLFTRDRKTSPHCISSSIKSLQIHSAGWRKGFSGKFIITCCSCRGHRFNSQQPYGDWLTTDCNSSSRGSNTLMWPPQPPGTHVCTHIYKGKTFIHIEPNLKTGRAQLFPSSWCSFLWRVL